MSLRPSLKHLGEELYIDTESGALYRKGDLLDMGPQLARVLKVLFERRGDFTKTEKIRDLAWPPFAASGSSYQAKMALNTLFAEHGIKHLIWIEKKTGWGYRLWCPSADIADDGKTESEAMASAIAVIQPDSLDGNDTARGSTSDGRADGNATGFVLSIDGIILNSVGELIFGTVSEQAVRKCRLIYKSSIEDFAFAVVYGSRLRSKFLPKDELPSALLSRLDSGKRLVREQGEGVIARLPKSLYSADPKDDKYRYGAVLESESARNKIGEYMRSFAEAMTIPGYEPQALCRQWLVREAEIYLGDDPTLFEERDDPRGFKYRKQYYESDFMFEVPRLLGNDILETLIGFLRTATEAPFRDRNVSPYSSSALRHFALSNVLTHVTTMYEYEQSPQSATARKLPFALRAAIKKQWNAEHTDQSVLRKLLVRSALSEALRRSEDANSREDLIRMLLWLREQQPFLRIRSRLEELDLLAMEPSESSERNAAILYAEISKDGEGEHARSERVEIDRTMVVRGSAGNRLPDPGADEYMRRLHKCFPELAPVPEGLRSSSDKPVHFGQYRSHRKQNLAGYEVEAA